MAERNKVAVACRIFQGVFSSERCFVIQLANGEHYRGTAPSHFFWNRHGQPLRENEPAQEADGSLAARIVQVEELPDGQTAVEIPDGEVVVVRNDLVRRRASEIKPNVPVRS